MTSLSWVQKMASGRIHRPLPMLGVLTACVLVASLWQAPTASAAGANLGGGAARGAVSFAPGYGIPPLGAPCTATEFDLNGSATTLVLNTIIDGYLGSVNLNGSGSSGCESTSGGSGALALSATTAYAPTGSTVSCIDLSGSYTRTGTDVVASLLGTCTVNNLPGVPVNFIFHGEFLPNNLANGAGTAGQITSATFAGAFAVLPA
ncbi:MAG: hypothetical protein ACYCO3_10125 [Mycobacteriales bacterium]